MIKAITRLILLQVMALIDGLIAIFFDRNEIVGYTFYAKQIQKTPSEKQQILVNYLKSCHKQTYKEVKNEKQKKEIDK